MNWHPTDDDLILHFYGEDVADERRIDDHLQTCGTCRYAWTEIRETMKLVDVAAVPEPGPGFERVMWARVTRTMPVRHAARAWWAPQRLLPAAGLAAALVAVTVGVIQYWPSATSPATSTTTALLPAADDSEARQAALARARERVLLAAAGGHFEQAEMVLVELMNSQQLGQADFLFERETAGDLVTSGRLYRETARSSGDVHLALMLEELESVLVELARTPELARSQALKSLRARIDQNSMLFKVRAVGYEIRERQRTLSTE